MLSKSATMLLGLMTDIVLAEISGTERLFKATTK